MRQDHVFDDGYADVSPLLEDIQALDRLADPQACGTRPDRVVRDEWSLRDLCGLTGSGASAGIPDVVVGT